MRDLFPSSESHALQFFYISNTPAFDFDYELTKEPFAGHCLKHLQNLLYLPCVIQPVTDQRRDDLTVTVRPLSLAKTALVAIHFSISSNPDKAGTKFTTKTRRHKEMHETLMFA
jgi:hypothetical protein